MRPAEPRRRVKVQIMTDTLAGEGEKDLHWLRSAGRAMKPTTFRLRPARMDNVVGLAKPRNGRIRHGACAPIMLTRALHRGRRRLLP
jgi:hypothetical protein